MLFKSCINYYPVNLFFNWSIIALQCYISFWCTTTWISYKYTYIHSLMSFPPSLPHPISLGHHRPFCILKCFLFIPHGHDVSYLFMMNEIFCISMLVNLVASSHMWLLGTLKVVSETKGKIVNVASGYCIRECRYIRGGQLLRHVELFEAPWTLALQVALYMGFSGQECWNGLHSLLQGIFPIQGSKLHLLHWQTGSLPPAPPWKPITNTPLIHTFRWS